MSDLLTELDRIKALAEAATKGPWVFVDEMLYDSDLGGFFGASGEEVCEFGDNTQYYPTQGCPPSEEDAAFIAEARTLVPRMERALRIAEEFFDQAQKPRGDGNDKAFARAGRTMSAAMLAALRGTDEGEGK